VISPPPFAIRDKGSTAAGESWQRGRTVRANFVTQKADANEQRHFALP
jgi:hypothetical protein